MKRKLLTSSLLTLALILGVSSTSFANTDTKDVDVSASIQGGSFELSTSEIGDFGDIELQATPQTYNANFENHLVIKDLSGMQQGWRLDVSATPFTLTNNGELSDYHLPAGSLALDAPENITRVGTGSGGLPASLMQGKRVIDDGAVTVARALAGDGMGEFSLSFPQNAVSLVVDATTAFIESSNPNATYQTTLTWNLVQAP
ncbi:hypothetical protein BTS2_3353 [Bacillus sp. TS-2]|nr:hypothetical protein BTS2_3353 [Bacillus sp. TS-2]